MSSRIIIQYFLLLFILFITTPCEGHGIGSLVNKDTLLELGRKLRLDALPAATIGIETSLHKSYKLNFELSSLKFVIYKLSVIL